MHVCMQNKKWPLPQLTLTLMDKLFQFHQAYVYVYIRTRITSLVSLPRGSKIFTE